MSQYFRKKKKRIVCFGDSITKEGSLEGGYVRRLKGYLENESLNEEYEIVGSGISGNKVTDLYGRVDHDILSSGAEYVVIFIGVNDVWHKLKDNGTEEVTFKATYDALVEKLQLAGINVIICTPTLIGECIDNSNQLDSEIHFYTDTVRTISEQYSTPLVDLNKAFREYNNINNNENAPFGILTVDGVHLNAKGNELVADEIWKVMAPLLMR